MKPVRALIAAVVSAITVAWGRLRARWYRHRRLPLVREALERATLPAASITAVTPPAGPLAPADGSPDYLSIPHSTRLLKGGRSNAFRVASTRILPAPPRELAVLRSEPWNVEVRRALTPRPRLTASDERLSISTPEPILRVASAVARPEHFGVSDDLATTTRERGLASAPWTQARLVPGRAPATTAPLHIEREPGVARPEALGLSPDGRPAAETVPAPRRHPPRLSLARATFQARYVDPVPSEAFHREVPISLGETMLEGAEAFFDPPAIGAQNRVDEWEIGSELTEQMEAVREQFLLRRDIDRVDYDASELTDIEGVSTEVDEAITAFTGLEFETLQPEPFAPLKMRLEAPSPDMAPPTEETERLLAWMLSAVKEHAPGGPHEPDER